MVAPHTATVLERPGDGTARTVLSVRMWAFVKHQVDAM